MHAFLSGGYFFPAPPTRPVHVTLTCIYYTNACYNNSDSCLMDYVDLFFSLSLSLSLVFFPLDVLFYFLLLCSRSRCCFFFYFFRENDKITTDIQQQQQQHKSEGYVRAFVRRTFRSCIRNETKIAIFIVYKVSRDSTPEQSGSRLVYKYT